MIENIRLSFQGIWAHKMRSFLTMLGIIIGIAAIIAIVSTIKGTSEEIKNDLVGSGNNVVEVWLQNGDWKYSSGDSERPENVQELSDETMQEICDIEEVDSAAKYRIGAMWDNVTYKSNSVSSLSVIGSNSDYFNVTGYDLIKGRLFTERDIKSYNKVVIIDDTVSDSLFEGENPIGQTIEIKNDAYVVVGVVSLSDDYSPNVENISEWYTYYQNSAAGKIFIPDSIWPMLYGFDEPYHVVVKAKSTEDMTDAGKKTEDILNECITNIGTENGEGPKIKYKSQDLLETAKTLQKVSESTNQQLIWIAGISLLVGGIGVMNIMLVSVTERTREIGLKKALGARKRVILGQFLTEAVVLTSLGGIFGVGGGIGLSYLVSDIADVPVAISLGAIVVSVVFSMLIGVIFGFIPSIKAANLNPIDALRYE